MVVKDSRFPTHVIFIFMALFACGCAKTSCAEAALRQTVLRQNGCAKAVVPKRRRQTVLLRGRSILLLLNQPHQPKKMQPSSVTTHVTYRNLKTSRRPFESQAQISSLLTSAATNQRGSPKCSQG